MTTIVDGTTGITFPSTISGVSASQQYSTRVLQVVQGTTTTEVNTTSTTAYGVETGLTATITPTSSTSKIMAIVYTGVCDRAGSNAEGTSFSLQRNGTEVQKATNFLYNSGSYPQQIRASVTMTFLDSPGTTSSCQYKLWIRTRLGNSTSFNTNNDVASIILMEIAG